MKFMKEEKTFSTELIKNLYMYYLRFKKKIIEVCRVLIYLPNFNFYSKYHEYNIE